MKYCFLLVLISISFYIIDAKLKDSFHKEINDNHVKALSNKLKKRSSKAFEKKKEDSADTFREKTKPNEGKKNDVDKKKLKPICYLRISICILSIPSDKKQSKPLQNKMNIQNY